MLNPHIYSLGKNLALNLLIFTDAHHVLDGIVDSSGFAMVTLMGNALLNSDYSLDVYNVTFLVDSHIGGQRNNPMFPKGPRECPANIPPLSFCLSSW